MRLAPLRCLGIIVVLALFATACGGTETASGEPVDRDAVAAAFHDAGEPLTIRLDMASSDPGSAVDVIFVPGDEDIPEPPYQVTVFETVASAEETARDFEAGAPSGTVIRRVMNVVVTVTPSISADREDRLTEALGML